jgi:malate synthase
MTTIQAIPTTTSDAAVPGVTVVGRVSTEYREILTPAALSFLASLSRRFEGRRRDLLRSRAIRQSALDYGALPDFPSGTAWIRDQDWTVAPIPADLLDRRVEISGPVDRKSVVRSLNSGANVFMADFEDGSAPTWDNNLRGQINLRDAVDKTIGYEGPDGHYVGVRGRSPCIAVRPRGWHLVERHVLVDGQPVSASLFDFALYYFHNARKLLKQRTGPYFYLPKIEHYFEARLWNDVFVFAQRALDLPVGTIRATMLIENVLAAFQMDEILFELREHSSGLRHGRWDYIASYARLFRMRPEFVMPDRDSITMDQRFLRASAELLIHTCHRRGIHAIGGKATQDPAGCDPKAKAAIFEAVMENLLREVAAGHDGTQVVHPGLVTIARGVFDAGMHDAHQLDTHRDRITVRAGDLLATPDGVVTEDGLCRNVSLVVRYLAAWLSGRGMIADRDILENAGTADIARGLVWQWQRHGVQTTNGGVITAERVRELIVCELTRIRAAEGEAVYAVERFDLAAELALEAMTATRPPEFLVALAYDHLD